MSKIVILGATGSLGRNVVQQAMAAQHDVSVVVRNPARLPAEVRDHVSVRQCDLSAASTNDLVEILSGHDAVINTAGQVTEGQVFVDLIDRVVSGLEAMSTEDRPACWFLAGVALLDLDDTGRRGVDLPEIGFTYWPHRANFDRISRSSLDWRLLCPGPMVEEPPLGQTNLRISLDRLPVEVPASGRDLPDALFLPVFASRIPEMIIPYADAASLMLGNLAPRGELSHHRVGVALPVGMRGRKEQPARSGGEETR